VGEEGGAEGGEEIWVEGFGGLEGGSEGGEGVVGFGGLGEEGDWHDGGLIWRCIKVDA
jgi:hypothetical protein